MLREVERFSKLLKKFVLTSGDGRPSVKQDNGVTARKSKEYKNVPYV